MNRDEQEMALWAAEYSASSWLWDADRAAEADSAVAAFRKRYPATPTAPAPVWYDDPPFEKGGTSYPCWVEGWVYPVRVAYVCGEWRWTHGSDGWRPLANRRVCPIVKPPEPTT